jgi:hypothetical protein
MKIFENYAKPTPALWRKIGDTILIASASLSGFTMGLPITEHAQLWLVFSFNVIGVIGKIITNFFKDESVN